MARQVPAQAERTIERSEEPSIVYLEDDRTADVVAALSSDTGLAIFRLLNDQPCTASEVAAELDVTVQNAGYHLDNLAAADLVEVVDTCYSEKGREMDIYAVARDPTILVLAAESERSLLRNAVANLAGAVGIAGVVVAGWRALGGAFERLLDA